VLNIKFKTMNVYWYYLLERPCNRCVEKKIVCEEKVSKKRGRKTTANEGPDIVAPILTVQSGPPVADIPDLTVTPLSSSSSESSPESASSDVSAEVLHNRTEYPSMLYTCLLSLYKLMDRHLWQNLQKYWNFQPNLGRYLKICLRHRQRLTHMMLGGAV
jgi:hypothetical protein